MFKNSSSEGGGEGEERRRQYRKVRNRNGRIERQTHIGERQTHIGERQTHVEVRGRQQGGNAVDTGYDMKRHSLRS